MTSLKTRLISLVRDGVKIRPIERLVAEVTKGRQYGTFLTKLPPYNFEYPEGSFRRIRRDGIEFSVDVSDVVGWFVYFGFKESARERLYSLIGEGNVVIDVGANLGDVSLHAAKIVGKTGMVVAFEPHPLSFQWLCQNLLLNNFGNILVFNKGLGDSSGEFKMQHMKETNSGMNRILAPDQEMAAEVTSVEVVTLDEYVSTERFPRIDIIKVDVEGFEAKVIKGASETIRKFRPKLFVELDDLNLREQQSSAAELVGLINEMGYLIYNASSEVQLCPDNDFKDCEFDIVCLPKD